MGSIFVSALRSIGVRCCSIGILALERGSSEPEKGMVASELCEGLGLHFYNELSTSQAYGFPMRALSQKEARALAEASIACFSESSRILETMKTNSSEEMSSWDIRLMVGKVSSNHTNRRKFRL